MTIHTTQGPTNARDKFDIKCVIAGALEHYQKISDILPVFIRSPRGERERRNRLPVMFTRSRSTRDGVSFFSSSEASF